MGSFFVYRQKKLFCWVQDLCNMDSVQLYGHGQQFFLGDFFFFWWKEKKFQKKRNSGNMYSVGICTLWILYNPMDSMQLCGFYTVVRIGT